MSYFKVLLSKTGKLSYTVKHRYIFRASFSSSLCAHSLEVIYLWHARIHETIKSVDKPLLCICPEFLKMNI